MTCFFLPDTGNVSNGSDSVRYDHGVTVTDHFFELVDEFVVLDPLLVDLVELGDTHDSGLSHVGVLVIHGIFQWVAQIV